jgi:hypothetical protein
MMATANGTPVYYPRTIPRGPLPGGAVLVHNHVRRAQRQGTRGFRFWLQAPSDRLRECECGWSGREHYRVIRESDR